MNMKLHNVEELNLYYRNSLSDKKLTITVILYFWQIRQLLAVLTKMILITHYEQWSRQKKEKTFVSCLNNANASDWWQLCFNCS